MEATSLCSRKRLCDGAPLQLHQEIHLKSGCRKRYKDTEDETKVKRKEDGGKENRNPEENLHRNRKPQTRNKDLRLPPQTRTYTRFTDDPLCGSAFRYADAIQSRRPEVCVARVKKTKIQTSIQVIRSEKIPDQKGFTPTDTCQDQSEPTRSTSLTRSRSIFVTEDALDTRTTDKKSQKLGSPGFCRVKRIPSKLVVGRTETRTKRKRKIHPSAFRGKGQLRLSITPEAGQLVIHIHEARGLMEKSHKSCDSFVKLTVTSDLHCDIRMKTRLVPNTKNPIYNRRFKLCVRRSVLSSRVMVSVVRRLPETRRSQLIGCMSFGIGSLMSSSKVISGWFYLLGEEFGRSKHLKVTSSHGKQTKMSEGEAGQSKSTSGDVSSGQLI